MAHQNGATFCSLTLRPSNPSNLFHPCNQTNASCPSVQSVHPLRPVRIHPKWAMYNYFWKIISAVLSPSGDIRWPSWGSLGTIISSLDVVPSHLRKSWIVLNSPEPFRRRIQVSWGRLVTSFHHLGASRDGLGRCGRNLQGRLEVVLYFS